ncbi:MAG: alpha/beta fold hydrolase [Pikeienuella sp.]
MPEITMNGARVHYIEAGPKAAPTIIFAHCSLAQASLWKGVIAQLSDRYHCIALDLPGHGGTDRGDESIPLQLQAADFVVGLTEALCDGPVHMAGVSLGGAVMGRVAITRPDLVQTLSMAEPIYIHLIADNAEHNTDNITVMGPVYEACERGDYQEGARLFMEGWGQPGQFDRFPEPVKLAVARSLRYLHPDFKFVDDLHDKHITRDQLAAIKAPVLLMQGQRTRASAKATIDEMVKVMPRAQRVEIEDAGHLSPVDQPKLVARCILDNLQCTE